MQCATTSNLVLYPQMDTNTGRVSIHNTYALSSTARALLLFMHTCGNRGDDRTGGDRIRQ